VPEKFSFFAKNHCKIKVHNLLKCALILIKYGDQVCEQTKASEIFEKKQLISELSNIPEGAINEELQFVMISKLIYNKKFRFNEQKSILCTLERP
jgi:hypothetical protein